MTHFNQKIFYQYWQYGQDFQSDRSWDNQFPFDCLDLHLLDETDSTNRVTWDILAQMNHSQINALREGVGMGVGMGMGVVVIADRQTAGRGQWGRSWQSERGGLYLSLGIIPHQAIGIDRLSLIPFFTAWGVAQALRNYHIPVYLKWPNDLLLDCQKLGGILVETRPGKTISPDCQNSQDSQDSQYSQSLQCSQNPQPSKSHRNLVIGIGLNWENDPPESGIALKAYQQRHHLSAIDGLEQLAAIVLMGLLAGLERDYPEGKISQTSVENMANMADFIQQYDRSFNDSSSSPRR